jgi:glutaredoxin
MKIPPSATRAPYLLWAALVIALWRVAASAGAADDAGGPPHTLACPTVTAYVREGCPHCTAAKAWLADAQRRLPGLRVELRDIGEPQARAAFEALSRSRHVQRPGVPTFAICDESLVGFGEATGALIEGLVTGRIATAREVLATDVPVFGELSPAALGLPAFTVLLGLVDGFNPCAMWVLLFLLSLLVHVRSRARIALVAGTFVAVSGLVYFAFMAAWLEVYFFIGFSRALQIVLGTLALLIGAVHVKDFFALHRGFSLSIPESVKPTLYQRMRGIVRAESLFAALGGVALIAVLVNLVELLCTAGLPALYTQVLSYYPLSDAGYYGYLALYNLAYVFDDALMVTIAVVTLGQHRLQERGGRWLKLLSGAVILVLGALLLFAPGLLVF